MQANLLYVKMKIRFNLIFNLDSHSLAMFWYSPRLTLLDYRDQLLVYFSTLYFRLKTATWMEEALYPSKMVVIFIYSFVKLKWLVWMNKNYLNCSSLQTLCNLPNTWPTWWPIYLVMNEKCKAHLKLRICHWLCDI